MDKKTLEELLETHRSQRDYALNMLRNHYYDMEEHDDYNRWVNRFKKHRDIVQDLEKEKPDD